MNFLEATIYRCDSEVGAGFISVLVADGFGLPLMKEAKDQFIARTIEVWQPRTTRQLTQEDARQITENMIGFFSTLMKWEADEKQSSVRETDHVCLTISA